MTDQPRVTLPFTWLKKNPEPAFIDSISEICTPLEQARSGDVVALVSKFRHLNMAPDLTDAYYLVKTTSGYMEILYKSLSEKVRRRIAYPLLEVAHSVWPTDSIEDQARSLNACEDEVSYYTSLITADAIVIFNGDRFEDTFGETHPDDLDQNLLDMTCITLGFKLPHDSAHAILAFQPRLDALHQCFMDEYISPDFDIAMPKATFGRDI